MLSNSFVLSVYFSVQRGGNAFIDEYAENAVFWDQSADVNFGHKLKWLSAVNPFDDNVQKLLDDKMSCAIMAQHYLWLMNRSQLMPKLRAQGGVIGAKLFGNRVSNEVRVREVRALKSLSARLVSGTVTAPHTILRADLAVTMARAQKCSSAVVVVDAPFPKFSYTLGVEDIKCYGTDDGEDLQMRLLGSTKELFQLGRPVILCNYATPTLILAYQEAGAYPIFTFKSPKDSTIYMLAVFYKGQGTDILYKVQEAWF